MKLIFKIRAKEKKRFDQHFLFPCEPVSMKIDSEAIKLQYQKTRATSIPEVTTTPNVQNVNIYQKNVSCDVMYCKA